MSGLQEHEGTEPPSADSVVTRLDEILEELAAVVADNSTASDAARIDRIARFDGWLAKLIKLRDRTCRNPYCEAPIRHIDHVTRHTEGGRTTFDNGRGTCAGCNYAREMPGWHVIIEFGLNGRPHTIHITTPTGHHYLSRAPDPP